MSRSMLFALLLVPLVSTAQIYKSTDERGNVTFSDSPSPDATSQRVEVPVTNTAPPPPQRPEPQAAPEPAEESAAVSYSVSISQPANETTFPMGPGNFSVSASVEPALGENLQLQLYLDGTARQDPQAASSWSLTNVFRGAHDITVAVVDEAGKHLAESEPVRVYVLRPSVNFRR